MSKIRVMSEHLSNRIAAGEVIERPASVVKELVENAVDAGADRVIVAVERAGSRLISVTDNGCGMDQDDVMLCIEPHGTSKLLSEDDLDTVVTLGFRGEAIPSIASVSRFEIFSRTPEGPEGTMLRIEGGRIIDTAPAGGAPGTCVKVRDLFFNTPARRKFLKSAPTEEGHISELMLNMALARPDIGFELIMDGKRQWRLAPSEPEQRIRELFGKGFIEKLLPLRHRENDMELAGFIAMPGFTRPGRREQRVFINGRAVEAAAIYRGIRNGYDAFGFEAGRFPPVILYLSMPAAEIDVNVHPAKREVRFKSEYAVTRAVSTAISAALRGQAVQEEVAEAVNSSSDYHTPVARMLSGSSVEYLPAAFVETMLPELELPPPQNDDRDYKLPPLPGEVPAEQSGPLPPPEEKAVKEVSAAAVPPVVPPSPAVTDAAVEQDPGVPPAAVEKIEAPPAVSSAAASAIKFNVDEEVESPGSAFSWPTAFIGIYDASYIICAGEDSLVLIDQHAAHERVLFEKFMDELAGGTAASQQLLLPGTMELSVSQLKLMTGNRELFERLGFDFEPAGGNTILLNAVPVRLGSRRQPEDIVIDMLEELLEETRSNKLPVDPSFAARAACRAAIKAHDQLTPSGAEKLLEELRNCRQGTLCPHGRPIMINISRRELEKRFFRR